MLPQTNWLYSQHAQFQILLNKIIIQINTLKQPLPETARNMVVKTLSQWKVHYTTHGTNGFTSRPKDESLMVKGLVEGHKCQRRDSDPYFTGHKHQSFESMHLAAQPRYAKQQSIVKIQASAGPNFI